jgi:hypothetical protein
LLLASVVVPAHRRLRPRIERLFFAERYALARGVERLLAELTACAGPQELLSRSGERLDALIKPECCVLYQRAGESFAPVFVRGRVVPPALDARSSLVAALKGSGGRSTWTPGNGPGDRHASARPTVRCSIASGPPCWCRRGAAVS